MPAQVAMLVRRLQARNEPVPERLLQAAQK